MHFFTADNIKLIHDFGWALMPYCFIVFIASMVFTGVTFRKEVASA